MFGFQSTCSRFHPFGIDFILSLWAIGIRYWSTAISDGKKIYIAPGNDLLLYSYMHWLWWQKSDKESIFTYTSVWKQMVYNQKVSYEEDNNKTHGETLFIVFMIYFITIISLNNNDFSWFNSCRYWQRPTNIASYLYTST